MEKYYITKVGNVFRGVEFKEGEEQPENMWLMLNIVYTSIMWFTFYGWFSLGNNICTNNRGMFGAFMQ